MEVGNRMGAVEVSAVLVAHDAAAHLPTCLAHLEQQSLAAARYEVVAVDAASADDTRAVLEAHRDGAPVRTRILRAPVADRVAALNAGMQAAEGRVVVLLGPEVLAAPGLLEAHLEAHAAHAAPVVALGAVLPHPQIQPQVARGHARWGRADGPPGSRPEFLDVRAVNVSLPRAALQAEGGLDGRFTDPDLAAAELVFRLGRRGLRPVWAPSAAAYLWIPARRAEERARAYHHGYSLPLLAKLTDPAAVALRHPMRQGPLRAFLDGLLLRFTHGAWPEGGAPDPAWDTVSRRLYGLYEARGWRDAQRGRPPRLGDTDRP
jgi:glycosyltransferase involved in cell wall biosynthesis